MYSISSDRNEFNSLSTKLHEAIWIMDKDYFTTFVNQSCAEMLDYCTDDLIGKHFFDYIDKHSLNKNIQKFKHIVLSLKEVVELQLIKRNGEQIQVIMILSVMNSIEGDLIGIAASVYNISEISDEKNVIGLDSSGLSKIFYNAPIGMCIIKPDGKLIDVNENFLKITGYSRKEIFNVPIQNLTHPEDRELNHRFVNEVLNNRLNDYQIEKRYLRKDSSICWVKMWVMVVRNSDKVILYSIVMIKDITEEKDTRNKLIGNERMAEMGRMIGYMSHAIKSPLSVIGMNIDFLDKYSPVREESSYIISIIRKELRHIESLIKDIINYSRNGNLYFIKINIREKLETIIQNFQHNIENKQIVILNNLENITILGDAQKIQILFLSLLENSIDAIGMHGTIEISSKQTVTKFVDIFIRDTGCGFDSTENLFKPFYTTKSTGTGMGLPIAKSLAEDQNGSIELIRAQAGDTVFKISLPLAE
jgi:PAS domain S-box-containing protein